jgi:hypothetical protein
LKRKGSAGRSCCFPFARGTFDDVDAVIDCGDGHGDFSGFVVTKNADALDATRVDLFARVALHAFGLEWPQALSVFDKLLNTPTELIGHTFSASLPVGKGRATIGLGGGPDFFELDATR